MSPATSLPAAAYPRFTVEDDRVTDESPLSAAFHSGNLSHLIARRSAGSAGDIWPAHSSDADAVRHYLAGQKALYENKDAVAAIQEYEASVAADPAYLQAWVGLAIACISDNTPGSLDQAEGILTRLTALEPDGWLTGEASSILHQNLAYLHLHRYRQGEGTAHRDRADALYAVADRRAQNRDRIELLCPWAFIKLERGDRAVAQALWTRARRAAETAGTLSLLDEYAAKYAPLRTLAGAVPFSRIN